MQAVLDQVLLPLATLYREHFLLRGNLEELQRFHLLRSAASKRTRRRDLDVAVAHLTDVCTVALVLRVVFV